MSCSHNRNRILEFSTDPTKAESLEPAYLQAHNQNKYDRQRIIIQRFSQTAIWWMVFAVETAREVGGRGWVDFSGSKLKTPIEWVAYETQTLTVDSRPKHRAPVD